MLSALVISSLADRRGDLVEAKELQGVWRKFWNRSNREVIEKFAETNQVSSWSRGILE
jgi:IS4 transposase